MDQETKQFLEEQFAAVRGDITKLELRVDSKFAELTETVTEVAGSVSKLATHMDERFDEITPAIERMDNHEKRIKYIEDRLPEHAKA